MAASGAPGFTQPPRSSRRSRRRRRAQWRVALLAATVAAAPADPRPRPWSKAACRNLPFACARGPLQLNAGVATRRGPAQKLDRASSALLAAHGDDAGDGSPVQHPQEQDVAPEADDATPDEPEVVSRRAPLSAFWEQWGLLGALVGLAITAGSIATAGVLGALGSCAGLAADGASEPARTRETGFSFLSPSEFMPGTIAPGARQEGHRGEDEDALGSALQLGMANFRREWPHFLRAARVDDPSAAPRRPLPSFLPKLVLSNEAVMKRERARPEVPTPVPVRCAYDVLCWFTDVVFENRPIQRFWFLENVARMPYFAYSSVLQLYETLGWWRSPELRAVHAAEEDNELHHLLVMESLGGDQRWLDRIFAQYGAIAYYWLLVLFFMVDPRWSYNFSRLLESHAFDTYGEFVDANAELLKTLPPPPIAVEYYLTGDFHLFDKFHTTQRKEGNDLRRPQCATLYDVFTNVRDDEEQHVLTMAACEEWVAGGEPAVPMGFNQLGREQYEQLVTLTPEGRAAWTAWGEEVAAAARAADHSGGPRPAAVAADGPDGPAGAADGAAGGR